VSFFAYFRADAILSKWFEASAHPKAGVQSIFSSPLAARHDSAQSRQELALLKAQFFYTFSDSIKSTRLASLSKQRPAA